jgi:hypothetical protein
MIPFILFTTLQNKNLMFYVFCYFQGPIQSQMDLGFFENQYFTRTDDISRKRSQEAQNPIAGTTPTLGRTIHRIGRLEHPQPAIKSPSLWSWHKTPYTKDLRRVS